MSTSYRIEVGYNSCWSRDEAEAVLRKTVLDICANPGSIQEEVMRLEGSMPPVEYAESYRFPWVDVTIRFMEREGGRDFCVYQSASGGDPGRSEKESMRRAFIRLVMEAMHRQKIEVTVIVS